MAFSFSRKLVPLVLQFGNLEPATIKVIPADEGTKDEENYTDMFEKDDEWILGAIPVKIPIDNFVKEKQVESVVVEHIPQSNPEKQILSEVSMQPCYNSKTQPKMTRSNDCQAMEKCLIMPITKIDSLLRTESSPIIVFCKNIQGTFNPKAYKLLEKSSYDFSNPLSLDKLEPELTGGKIYGLTKAHHKLRKQRYHVDQLKTVLGFTSAEAIKIHVTRKEKCINVHHISAGSDYKG
ncbi:hypothetical protein BUALT_Bualt16G0015000 [Buddleja alternifolia]|uniref:Uncharacterized protein n=1 Tax=Buddleja alternifolia TaxID=168488 RepID=A0AAV6WDL2_9LAMI|nr:hypothetical protein BUALT_Bualt16G0015000 [Buddleja alternifolia]